MSRLQRLGSAENAYFEAQIHGLHAAACCNCKRINVGGLRAILTSTELPVAVLAGALLLGEKVTPLIAGGVVIIVGAIALAQLDDRRKRKADQASCAV